MANQAEPVTMATAFAEDAEAQARFRAHKRYLARPACCLLPVAAVVIFLLVWWQAVEIFDIQAVHRALAGGGRPKCSTTASTC